MNRLTYLKGQRSLSRKELKKYILMFRDDIEQESGVSFPSEEEIKSFTSKQFDNWFSPIASKFLSNDSDDVYLLELIEWYICSINNVASAEEISINNL